MGDNATDEPLTSVCDRLRKEAERSAAVIQREKSRTDGLRAMLNRLNADPNADAEVVAALKSAIAELTEGIAEAEEALAELHQHIAENCS